MTGEHRWDPAAYQRYARERARPFDDLVAQVHAGAPRTVVDLGAGPGDRTATLLERWPTATVTGVDSSLEMVRAAAVHAVPGRLTFVEGDVRSWRPPEPVDVVISNATLQWIPEHLEVLPELAGVLAPGGWLAFQVPGNGAEPSHALLAEVRKRPRWRAKVGAGADRALAVHEPVEYFEALAGAGLRVDAWETTYLHVLQGEDAVLEWIKGTGLRPVLAALDEDDRSAFLEEYGQELRVAYPQRPAGTLLKFRRIFVVAQREER